MGRWLLDTSTPPKTILNYINNDKEDHEEKETKKVNGGVKPVHERPTIDNAEQFIVAPWVCCCILQR